MASITQITAEEIERLQPNELVHLLRILLHAEARLHCVNRSGIHVPHQITVADGGNDGEWNAEIAPGNYIYQNYTVYQCKACEMGEQDCANELFVTTKLIANDKASTKRAKKPNAGPRVLKSQVAKAIKHAGAFVFFCRKGYVQDAIDKRIDSATKALDEAGAVRPDGFELHFLGGNQITDWVNKHAAAFAFVCRCINRAPEIPVADFVYWSGDADFRKSTFQTNQRLDRLIVEVRSLSY